MEEPEINPKYVIHRDPIMRKEGGAGLGVLPVIIILIIILLSL